MSAVHMAFLSDAKSRCGSRSLLKSPDPKKVELARSQVTPPVFTLLEQELELYFAEGGRGDGDPIVIVEAARRSGAVA